MALQPLFIRGGGAIVCLRFKTVVDDNYIYG